MVCFHTSFPADVLDRPKTAHPSETTFPNPIEPEGKHPNPLPCFCSSPPCLVLQGSGGSSVRNNQDRILEIEERASKWPRLFFLNLIHFDNQRFRLPFPNVSFSMPFKSVDTVRTLSSGGVPERTTITTLIT